MEGQGNGGGNPASKRKKLEDFKIGKKIGEGSFSKVCVCIDKETRTLFAIKVIRKSLLLKYDSVPSVFRERDIMVMLRNKPFFVSIESSFQDRAHLYFVMTYARRGELLRYINELKGLDQEATRYFTVQLVCALECLHSLNIIHRDLKPENILVNEHYHVMISDFGTSKILDSESDNVGGNLKRASSFVGTAQYVSPEILLTKEICKSSDLWALGVTIYQMVTSKWAFYDISECLLLNKILKLDYQFESSFPSVCRDLVTQLLKLNPYERLGDAQNGGYEALKAHPFFENVDWAQVLQQVVPNQIKNCQLEFLPDVCLD